MNKNFLHFMSEVPAILELNGRRIGFIDNKQTLELDVISKTNHLFIHYSPISCNQQAIPYLFKLNTLNTPNTDNKNIKIIPFPNNHFDILMQPFYYNQVNQTKVLFNKSIGKYFISITTNIQTNIIIYSGATIVYNLNTNLITNVKVDEIKDLIIIKGIINNNLYKLIIIDTNNFLTIFDDTITSIEEVENSLSTYKPLYNLCKYAEVNKIDYETKNVNKYYVYEENSPKTNINKILVPKAFLECIQVNDESTCKTFLSSNYSNVNISQFKNYFGEIKEIHLNRHQINENKLNYTIKTNVWKNYNFLIDNNKIYDIEEIF